MATSTAMNAAAAATSLETPAPPTTTHQRGQRNRRRGAPQGDGVRRGGRRDGRNASSNNNPNSTNNVAGNMNMGTPTLPMSDRGGGSGGRGRGRGRPPPSRGMRFAAGLHLARAQASPGRRFAGQLTRPEAPTEDAEQLTGHEHGHLVQGSPVNLRPDAPTFVPGQTGVQTQIQTQGQRQEHGHGQTPAPSKVTGKQAQRHSHTAEKSTADDMATRIHEDIANGLYECPICTSELGRKSKVWSCHLCWTVFHLHCIKKWSGNEGAVFSRPREEQQQQQQQEDERHQTTDSAFGGPSSSSPFSSRQWRCPGCNLPQDTFPSLFTCWCEKEVDPRPLPGLPPHSCGQTCSKPRKGCPHPCELVCHAGPCPPCKTIGPTQPCFCGRDESTKRCVDTDYENGWSCGEMCGEMLPCLEHTCQRPCHEGLCGECVERVHVRCYCGRVEKTLRCSEKEEEKPSVKLVKVGNDNDEEIEAWTGSFNCGATCDRLYNCGIHTCQEPCHSLDKQTPHCPFSPDLVTHCPCSKTPLVQIQAFQSNPRTSCQDPVPNCEKPCQKVLPCGHICPTICHSGPCPPCVLKVDIKCRCGRSTFNSMCQQGVDDPPFCFRVCGSSMNCGRHTCSERCCPGGRKAIERQATRKKLKALNVAVRDDEIEAEHICTRICGRQLKCMKHTCDNLCHKGPCTTCLNAIFDDISCHCGRTILHPPLPCGTEPPACSYPCGRPKRCGHPQTQHNCHSDNQPCPKCPYLTEKWCLCGKKTLKNQPCWVEEPRCGLVCDKLLKCGSHNCRKTCHSTGDCEDWKGSCQQECSKTKKLCGHPCTEICHAPSPCVEQTPCQATVSISCPCGRRKQERRCNASRSKAPPAVSTATTPSLKCDEECARLQRNRALASAFNISV